MNSAHAFATYFRDAAAYSAYRKHVARHQATFGTALLNNHRWRKIFRALLLHPPLVKRCELGDFFNSCVVYLRLDHHPEAAAACLHADHLDLAITTADSPVAYETIEYLEFAKSWPLPVAGRLLKPRMECQDTAAIKKMLDNVGEMEWLDEENSLQLLAYR